MSITEISKKSLKKLLGYEPTEEQRNKWLSEFESQTKTRICSASEIPPKYELTLEEEEERKNSLVFNQKGSTFCWGPIFHGATHDERLWNALAHCIEQAYFIVLTDGRIWVAIH